MKRMVGMILVPFAFMVGVLNVKAREITFKSIGDEFVSKQDEVNSANTCFNSSVNATDTEINISYTIKSNAKECVAVPEWKTKFVYKDGKYLLFESSVTEELVRNYSSKPYGLKSVIEMDDFWLDVLLDYLDLPSGIYGSSFKGKYEMIHEDYPYYLESTESLSGGSMSFYERFAYCFSDVIEVSSTSNSVTLKTVGFMKEAVSGNIERSSDKTNYKSLGKSIKVGDSFTDTGLTPLTKYYYRFQDVVVEATTLAQGSSNGGENTSKDPKPSESQDNIKNPNTGDGTLAMVFFLVCGLIFVGYKYIKNKKEAIR